MSIRNARGGFPSGPFHEGPPSALTSTKSALSGSIRAMHSEMPITRLIGAKMKDKVWRNSFNRGLGKDSAAGEGRAWTGNMVGSHSG